MNLYFLLGMQNVIGWGLNEALVTLLSMYIQDKYSAYFITIMFYMAYHYGDQFGWMATGMFRYVMVCSFLLRRKFRHWYALSKNEALNKLNKLDQALTCTLDMTIVWVDWDYISDLELV